MIEGVGGFGFFYTIGIALDGSGFLVDFIHFIGVAVVGGDDSNTLDFIHHGKNSGKAQIERFHGNDGSFKITRMPYHVAVGEINPDILILAGTDGFNEFVGDFGALHPGTLFKGNHIGGNLQIGFIFLGEFTGTVAVPKICDVPVLLGFG